MALKALFLLSQLGLVASLSAGDCAFVGIYGDQDDFAVVLMEDADGEVLSLTEELPSHGHFEVSSGASAKKYVADAKRGTVLKKKDFDIDTSSFLAPSALTLYSGSSQFPTALCSINLQENKGTARALTEVNTVVLGLTESAQYSGATSGSKEELQEQISDPMNWQRSQYRKLSGFSIAKMNSTSSKTESTTSSMVDEDRVVVSGCIAFQGPILDLMNDPDAIGLFAGVLAWLFDLPEEQIQNIQFVPDGGCAPAGGARRLQEGGTLTYDLVFPGTNGAAAAKTAAESAIAQLDAGIDLQQLNTKLKEEIAKVPSLAALVDQFEILEVSAPVITEEAGTTTTTAGPTSSTRTPWGVGDEPDEEDAACHGGMGAVALSLLMALPTMA
eukprot:Skav228275  [mRNA]  locus=scaffold6733:43106:79217:- [translate_table: standard]